MLLQSFMQRMQFSFSNVFFFFFLQVSFTLKFGHTLQLIRSSCLQGRHHNDRLRWKSSGQQPGTPSMPSAVQYMAIVMVFHLLSTVPWSWCCDCRQGAVVHGKLPLVCSRSSHKLVVDLLYEQAGLEGEGTIKSIRKQSTPCWLPLITLKGEKSFKSSVWLLNQLQLGYKHKLKGSLAAECQQRCLLVYCIRLLSRVIIWSAAQNDKNHYDSCAWLCDSHTFTNIAAHKVGIIMFSGLSFFYSPSYIQVITFDQINKFGEGIQLNWCSNLGWANYNPVFTAQWNCYQQLW